MAFEGALYQVFNGYLGILVVCMIELAHSADQGKVVFPPRTALISPHRSFV